MKFHLAINLDRMDNRMAMTDVARHTLKMAQMAEAGGFSVVWAAEHHALEMTIAPNPFQILTWLATHTNNIRLGVAVAVAPYWHPINLAGEAAFTDLISNGRLELGIGSGAYQREFDRIIPGVKQTDGWRYVHEMVPALKQLWAGDYEHQGEFWSFPVATSVPKPLQKPHPPIWMSARAPITFNYAVENNYNIMSWPLTRPFAEAQLYKTRLDDALTQYPHKTKPTFAIMRHTAVYDAPDQWEYPVQSIQKVLGQFENVFRNIGGVVNGFPQQIPLTELANRDDYNPQMLRDNLMFGAPEEIIAKLKHYEKLGVDAFIYYANIGWKHDSQKHSLDLFCKEVIPAFAN